LVEKGGKMTTFPIEDALKAVEQNRAVFSQEHAMTAQCKRGKRL